MTSFAPQAKLLSLETLFRSQPILELLCAGYLTFVIQELALERCLTLDAIELACSTGNLVHTFQRTRW
jgi:hypothetical protein